MGVLILKKINMEALEGNFLGGGCYLIYAFSLFFILIMISISLDINCFNQITFWVLIGPSVIFVICGQYIFTKNFVTEKERTKLLIGIKSDIIAFFLWLIVMALTLFLNVEFGSFRNMQLIALIGGFISMFITYYIFLYSMKQRLNMEQSVW